jgi:integrase
MARTLQDSNLGTRAARLRLKPRGKPYYRQIESGLHLGYRRLKGRAGTWQVRQYAGQQSYAVETIASADDFSDADGTAVLSFSQAQTAARARMVRHAHAAAGKSGPLSVSDAIRNYFENLEQRGKPLDARYRAEALIVPALGDIEVESLTTPVLQRWLADVAATKPRVRTAKGETQRHRDLGADEESKRRRRSTANRTWTILRAALNRAWRDGHVSSNAAWAKVQPFHGVDAARLRFLSVAEAQRLINAADAAFRPLVQAALLTGARYGELIRLTGADFHPDSGTIVIRTSKTGRARHVVLSSEGVEFFAQVCVGKSGDDDRIFTNGGGKPWKRSNQGRPMQLACARAKVSPPINFHGLRHTYASLAVMNGMPLMVLARNLGHANTRMIERHYGHLSPGYVADAVRASAPTFGFKPSNVRRLG